MTWSDRVVFSLFHPAKSQQDLSVPKVVIKGKMGNIRFLSDLGVSPCYLALLKEIEKGLAIILGIVARSLCMTFVPNLLICSPTNMPSLTEV